jgi:proteasome lid subunit RPN8/RPN11
LSEATGGGTALQPEPDRRPGLGAALQGAITAGGVPVYIYQDVLRHLLRHARHHDHVGGVLLGTERSGQDGPYVEIEGFSAAGPVPSNTELASRLSHALDEPRSDPAGPEPVGWFHCRLAPGPGPTPEDLAIHRSCFERPSAVMMLVEVATDRLALFQVKDTGPLSTGFYLVTPDSGLQASDFRGNLQPQSSPCSLQPGA